MIATFRRSVISSMIGAALLLVADVVGAHAAPVDIVALGASNTAGKGVGMTAAWPARLEALLRAKGYDATVVNAGHSGATSAQILTGVDSVVTSGTRLVVLQILRGNDARHGVNDTENAANTRAAIARIRAHGAKVVLAGPDITVPIIRAHHQFDGIHLTEEGHALLAARLLPQVIQAIGRPR